MSRKYCFFTGYTKCHALQSTAQNTWGRFSIYLNLYKINLWQVSFIIYGHHWKLCAEIYILLLENTTSFYILLLFCLYIEVLPVSSLFKCPIAIKCSESREETLQIFLVTHSCWLTIEILFYWNVKITHSLEFRITH